MSVHLNLRNGKIRTDDKEDIVQTAAPAAQETAAQTSADYERQVRLNLKKGTVSYGGKSYGLSHEGTSNAGSQALQERIDARSREQKARTGNIWQAQSQTANRQSMEARQEETARQKVITMLAAGAAGLGSRSTGSARGTASSYLQGGGSTGDSAYAAALSAPAGRTQRYVSGREQLGQDILNLNRRQDAEQALGSRVMSDTARTDTLEQAARDTVIDAMVRQAQAGGQTQADKARAFDQVNAWLDENPEAKTLWDAERGAGRGNPAAQRAAQRIRAGMSEEEERAYEQAGELYDSYGSAWSAAHRLGSDVKGLAQQAAGSWATLAESIAPATRDEAANNSAERHALAELRRLTDEGKVFETDENGQIRTSDEYEAALARYNAAKEAGPQDNQKTVLTDENSAGMRLYHEGGENLAKAQAGLGSAARFGADTANAIAGNLPNMALALIPGVGPAVSLGALGAQAAGGRMAELYDEDTGADEALWRGLVSGGIEVGTEVLPVGSWVEIVNRGGKGLVRNLLQQMGEEGTEEAVGYVVNYLADVAAKDPNAEFSWAELAQNAGMGAISGGFYGAAGTGLNLALNRANTRMAENLAGGENQVQQANTRTAQAVREAALTQAQDMQQAVADPLGAAARLEEETRPGSTAAEEKYAPQAAQSAQESAQNADGELAARQAENAAKAAADALAQEKAAQDADTLTGEEAAQRADAQAVSEAALAQAAAERYAQESAPQADTVALERGTVRRETVEGIQAFADAEESYTPYMKKALVERYKGQSPAVYVQEMHSMYNAGREGVLSFEQAKSASAARAAVVQDDAALYTAYSLGRNAASALTVQQPAAAVTEPEVRYDGVPAGSAQVPDAVLQGVAEKFGMNVDVVRQLTADNGGEVNGYWAAGAAALTVGENSANAYQTVQHELTHWMEGENPEGWARLRARTMAFAASEYGLGGVQQHIGRYESSYGDRTQAADEYARDLFAGIMSSEENTRAFVEYVSEDSETTREEKRSVLQALREMLDKIVGSIRSLLRGGDATLGAADGRRLAERAENAEKARAVCDEALAELETARRNARARLEAAGQADSDTKNAPAASEGVKLSKNEQSGKKDFREDKYYRRQVEQWQSLKPGSRVKVGTVQEGSALNQVGFAAADVYFDASKLQKELTNHGDHLTAELVQRIPELLNDPIAITQAMTLKNTVNVFGDLQTADGTPVLVGVMVAKDVAGRNAVTKIRTIHARSDFAKLITDESILYLNENKKKTKEWFQVRGNRVPLDGTSFGLIRSIQLGDADVKYSEKISGAVTQEELEKARAEYREAERALKDSWAREKAWRQQDEAEHGRFLARLMQHKRAGDAVQWKQSQEYLEYKAAENRFKAEQDALLEQRDLAQEVIKQAREQEQDKAWQKKQAQQAEYDAEVRESGMSREDYHREQAADTYGTTKWFESAGYILPDGRMLDFSGGSDKSVRDLDHRDIQSVYGPAELARGAEQTDYLNAFIAEGNVRVMAESPGVDVSAETEVSDAQKAAIAEMADTLGAAKHGFNLDISRKDGSTAATRWYEGRVRGSEVVRDLETYYRTGSLPEQSELNRFRYSKKVDAEKHPQRRKTGEEQVSFETLRELPDMEITEVEENDLADKPVKEILDAGLASTQRIPGKNSGSVVNRYTGDTIVVTRAGLRHGLLNAAQIQKNAPYVGQIGPILENAVKVNELEARGKEVRSDLYLGAARMSDGSLMGIRFVVNMYEDGQKVLDADSMEPLRGSLYAHTGRQIKNGTESLKGREVSTNAVALYGSNISIEDFLGSVKEELGENLSANVKYAFGMDTETTAGFGEGLRYSAPTEADYDDLRAQNRELAQKNLYMEQQMEVLWQEFKASGGHSVSRASARGIAQRILKLTGSKYGVDRLSGDLWRVFNVEGNGEPTLNADAMDALTDVMRGVLNESEQKNTELREYYKPLRETLRGTTLEVRRDSAEFAELMNAYGDGKNGRQWGNVRKALFGRLNVRLTDGAGNWDTMQAELAESWPGTFDAENTDITAFTDAVLGVYEASVPVVENPYGMDMETLALDLANEAVEGYLNSPTRRTMADRAAQDAQKAARAEYRKGRRDAQAEMKALYDQAYANRKERFDAMLEVYKQKAQNAKDDAVMRERMQKLKWVQTRDKKLVRQQAEFATRMQRRNDGLLYRKSRDSAQKQVRTLAAWLREPTDTKHVPKKMRTAVLNVLNLFDWNTSNAGTATAQRWQETMKDIALMAKDAEALEHMGAGAGDYADFDPSLPGYIDTLLQQTGGKTGIGQFSGEQMRQLDVILKSMTKSITQANKLLAEGSRETIAAAGDASVAEMAAREKQQVKNKNNLLGKAVKAAADTTAGDALGQLLGVDMMDAGRYFAALGDTAEQMYRPIREGFDKRAWKLRETVEWTQALLKDKTDVDKWTGRKAEKRKFTVTDAASMADTVLELTPGQAMELYCLSQRAAAKEHLMIGGIQLKDAKGKPGRRVKLTPGQLAEITGSLTTEQVKTARAMQEYLSTTAAAWGNEVSNTLYGYDKFTETHYWPMSSSNDFTATTAASSRQAGLNGIKNAGMTKALVKGANNPLVVGDAFDTFFGHTTEMATYYGWCIPLSDMMKWYNWRAPESAVSVKEGIDNLLGRKGKDYFETLMRDINGQASTGYKSGGERLMNTVTRNWKVAKVGANLRVAVQQPTAYFRAGAEIAPKYLRGALGRGAANLGKGLAARAKGQTFEGGMAKAEKYCAIAWWKSQGYFETNLGKDVRAMALDEETALERVRSASTAMAEWGDKTTWGALWNACELETLDKHPELEYDSEEFNRQCAARLSEIVDKTQVVDSVLHRSQIMRSTDVWTKVLTNFMAEPIKSYAMVAQAAVNLAQNPKDKAARARFARVGVTYVATAMATAAAAAAVDTLRHPRGDDEDDDERLTAASLAKVYAQNVLENFADGVNLPGNLPLLQDIIGFITERADGNATYTIKRNDVEWIGDVMDAVSVWNKYLTGKTTSLYQVLYRTANAVSNVTGVAVSAALRDVKGVYDTLTGLAGADDPLGMDKDLNRIALALDGGDADKASRLFAGQVDAKVKSGTDPADAVTAARSTVTKLYSKAYQQADSEERAEMLDALMGLEYGGERVYDLDTVTGWGVTVGSADITAALDTADADAVQEMIDERVRQLERADEEAATQASRMMEAGTLTREEYDSVLDSARDAKELRTAIRSAITKEMKPRYQAADTAGRQEIAEMLCRLKVDGLTVYEADDFKKWE